MSSSEESRTPNGPPRLFDADTAHPARRYCYWLGGKDHYEADRVSGDRIAEAFPSVRVAAVENRRFLHRAVAYLARTAGITQFLDVGAGIPASPNVHEIAQGIVPAARVAAFDHDPLVVAHGRALTTSNPAGAVGSFAGDLRAPETILGHPLLSDVVDLRRPVGLLLVAVLHFLTDTDLPGDVVAHLVGALPAGSAVVVSHATLDLLPAAEAGRLAGLACQPADHGAFRFRTRAEITGLLGGLDLVAPGLVPIVEWRPGDEPRPQAGVEQSAGYAAVARLP